MSNNDNNDAVPFPPQESMPSLDEQTLKEITGGWNPFKCCFKPKVARYPVPPPPPPGSLPRSSSLPSPSSDSSGDMGGVLSPTSVLDRYLT